VDVLVTNKRPAFTSPDVLSKTRLIIPER